MAAPAFSPAGGTTVTDATGNITLTFAEAIRKDAAGAALANADLAGLLTLKKTDANGAAITFTATINAAKKVITIDPSAALEDGAVYVAISNGYFDAHGNRGAASNATFTVDTSVAAPAFSPAGGTTVTDATGNITLTFAEAIRKDADGTDLLANTDLRLAADAEADRRQRRGHHGGLHGDDQRGEATVITQIDPSADLPDDPSADLPDGAVYVAISNGYFDAHGNRGAAANATFTVDTSVAAPASTRPAARR